MSARENIFVAIRKARPNRTAPAEIAAQAQACSEAMKKTLPPLEASDLVALFTARAGAEKVGATLERVETLAELPGAVARYVAANELAPEFSLQPDPRLQKLDWGALRPDAPLRPDSPLAVGIALCGVAETGSLVFHSGREAPTLYEFLPLHHLVALSAQSLVPRMEDYAALASGLPVPRNVNLVTGASGTTDIEGVLARGAHGPGRLHIVIVNSVI
ncbi:lactate utilization protein [Rhodoblastus acidophilus]|uniref:Lactate utilization protein n=1 Tax=Candidatus Rhodoblastus alkanivorans TaxID=2954117 RepID=A0ABS9Z6P4_9HYPH|nr:lactate utilization protein [Candidatus Rhodoblastus alkanivorans]MCI4680737.1 lactate utilization protein [Candidatus Rhodoblastus alkanivorans]MCI4683354.1 lactate utilization protein [Candidatus Rhodoblastus alkanivorans]MDI4640667.1 lactate utilization protein [Rhodoblastus acidophilus]